MTQLIPWLTADALPATAQPDAPNAPGMPQPAPLVAPLAVPAQAQAAAGAAAGEEEPPLELLFAEEDIGLLEALGGSGGFDTGHLIAGGLPHF